MLAGLGEGRGGKPWPPIRFKMESLNAFFLFPSSSPDECRNLDAGTNRVSADHDGGRPPEAGGPGVSVGKLFFVVTDE